MLSVAAVYLFVPITVTNFSIAAVTVIIVKVVWWFAASWLLAGFVRAVLIFRRQAKETRFLQDLFAGRIYLGAISASSPTSSTCR